VIDDPTPDQETFRAQVDGWIEELDRFLASDRVGEDALTYSGLDGLIACMAIEGELDPEVWGEREPELADEEERQRLIDTIRLRYAIVCIVLHEQPDAYEPVLEQDPDGTIHAAAWAQGFLRGVELRGGPEWRVLRHVGVDVLLPLAALGTDDEQLRALGVKADLAELRRDTTDKLGDLVRGLYLSWHARRPASAVKIGRNAPCPCGSGRKYKRCCGA
jgi:uncharacterized protein